MIETEGKKEKDASLLEKQLSAGICLSVQSTGKVLFVSAHHNEMDSSEVPSTNEPTCPESSSF